MVGLRGEAPAGEEMTARVHAEETGHLDAVAGLLGELAADGVVLVFLLVGSGYPIYHLTHARNADLQPAAAQFPIFIGVVMVLAVLILACGGSLGAAVQHYTQRQPQRPPWLTPALTGLLGLVIGVILIGGSGEPTTSAGSNDPSDRGR